MREKYEPRIVAFLCNWCSYAAADLAGVSRLKYPPNLRVIKVMCSGRVNPLHVLYAFSHGADGVVVAGCHPGDCHYRHGNYIARRRIGLLKNLLSFVGLEEDRLVLTWASAAEGEKFAEMAGEVAERVGNLGPLRHPIRKVETYD